MDFLPYLQCKECHKPMSLPLPIQDETPPRRILWPWGALSGNFLCPSCWHVSSYLAEECRWPHVESTAQHQNENEMAIYQIDIPCDKTPCLSHLHMLAVMPLGSYEAEAASLLRPVDLNGMLCDNGHANYGKPDPTGAGGVHLIVTKMPESWS